MSSVKEAIASAVVCARDFLYVSCWAMATKRKRTDLEYYKLGRAERASIQSKSTTGRDIIITNATHCGESVSVLHIIIGLTSFTRSGEPK